MGLPEREWQVLNTPLDAPHHLTEDRRSSLIECKQKNTNDYEWTFLILLFIPELQNNFYSILRWDLQITENLAQDLNPLPPGDSVKW